MEDYLIMLGVAFGLVGLAFAVDSLFIDDDDDDVFFK